MLGVDCFQFSKGLEFLLVLFARTLNKVTLDRIICFAKVCAFTFAYIVSKPSQSGEENMLFAYFKKRHNRNRIN